MHIIIPLISHLFPLPLQLSWPDVDNTILFPVRGKKQEKYPSQLGHHFNNYISAVVGFLKETEVLVLTELELHEAHVYPAQSVL